MVRFMVRCTHGLRIGIRHALCSLSRATVAHIPILSALCTRQWQSFVDMPSVRISVSHISSVSLHMPWVTLLVTFASTLILWPWESICRAVSSGIGWIKVLMPWVAMVATIGLMEVISVLGCTRTMRTSVAMA